jgi:hypothetical protein
MRLFFAGDMPVEKTLEMVRAYRSECRAFLVDMAEVPKHVDAYREQIPDPGRAEYWRMTALFGRTFYESSVEWADSIIATLENKTKRKKEKQKR